MDTRQLAAFCAVVERRSFSQAAERLGVTQPAISLQVRSLEQRLGQGLRDRPGTPGEAEGALSGALSIGASTGPGGTVVPLLLCEFQRRHPDVRVDLQISDTQH